MKNLVTEIPMNDALAAVRVLESILLDHVPAGSRRCKGEQLAMRTLEHAMETGMIRHVEPLCAIYLALLTCKEAKHDDPPLRILLVA